MTLLVEVEGPMSVVIEGFTTECCERVRVNIPEKRESVLISIYGDRVVVERLEDGIMLSSGGAWRYKDSNIATYDKLKRP